MVDIFHQRLATSSLVRFDTFVNCSVDYLRELLARRLGLLDEACQHFRAGLEWATRERCPVEAGRCLQGLADIAERRGDPAEAMDWLDKAGALFSQYCAKLYLDQVIAKKEILKA